MNIFNWLDLLFLLMLIIFLYFLKQSLTKENKLIDDPFNKSKKAYLIYPNKLIRQCGISVAGFWLWYWSVKWCSALVLVIIAIELSFDLWIIISAGIVSFLLMDMYLLINRSNRRRRINLSLVFFINLLIVFLKSGLSLSQAFRKAAQFGLQKDNPLAAELELIAYELDAGRDRTAAFDNLSVRTGVEALNKLSVIIKAGIEVGSPVGDGLQSLADFLRLQQDQQLTSRINRKALESTLPMAMVCFPMFFVLVFFPAGQQISEIMKLLGDIL
ncbi:MULTISPECIES: type II secretion system F family protein [unclassified Colwellia]|uniref:type II secretion system F family protein n=1 Tax=unclassified Colwellia TaxID=196834 RepID=UPI0015F6DEEE|nr:MULTISPECIES: type II secretion system F family protein [unclassified Colwellia]MBA6380297.1 type II secretion system F family protein [Colwellia sp. BRX10-7]MBA6387695.1 type II secretion system F family protein [Colwellia sp. BRX10-2]MBA6402719.1 type II secretion system F family protein [Colwellia sp. BRX10-5]MBA6405160.1 type II secretion system F family protein [Colwellia sp. BRX10-1]